MAGERKAIRAAIRAALVAAATAAGDRVHSTLEEPLRKNDLAALNVLPGDDDSDDQGSAPRIYLHNFEVIVEVWAAGASATICDDLDDLVDQVRAAMCADRYFGGACGESVLKSTGAPQIDVDGDRAVALVQLVYQTIYRAFAPEPVAASNLDDFKRVATEYSSDGKVRDITELTT